MRHEIEILGPIKNFLKVNSLLESRKLAYPDGYLATGRTEIGSIHLILSALQKPIHISTNAQNPVPIHGTEPAPSPNPCNIFFCGLVRGLLVTRGPSWMSHSYVFNIILKALPYNSRFFVV